MKTLYCVRAQKGIILWNTLLIVALVSTLFVSQLQWIHLLLQSLHHHSIQLRAFHALEKNALLLVKKDKAWPDNCVVIEGNPTKLIQELKEGRGCGFSAQGQQYRYFLEDLGSFPCVKTKVGGEVWGTHHQRLTLLLDVTGRSFVIQMRFAWPHAKAVCASSEERYIRGGMISWSTLQ